MANRYWVGGTGNWDNTAGTKWSATSGGAGGAGVPGVTDSVFFDANSGAVTVTETLYTGALNIDFTGFIGTFTGTHILAGLANLTMGSGMTFTHTGGTEFTSTGSITSNGIVFKGDMEVVGSITTTLQDNYSAISGAAITLTDGTFDANNFNVTCDSIHSSNANSRTLTMGSGTWTLLGDGTVWDLGTSTLMNLNANTSTIKFTDSSVNGKAFNGGGLTYYNLWNTCPSTGSFSITGDNTFNDIKIDAGASLYVGSGSTQIFTTLTCIGTSLSHIIIDKNGVSAGTLSCASGTITVDYCDIGNSIATGGATFNATHSINNGNNTGWNFIGSSNGMFLVL